VTLRDRKEKRNGTNVGRRMESIHKSTLALGNSKATQPWTEGENGWANQKQAAGEMGARVQLNKGPGEVLRGMSYDRRGNVRDRRYWVKKKSRAAFGGS